MGKNGLLFCLNLGFYKLKNAVYLLTNGCVSKKWLTDAVRSKCKKSTAVGAGRNIDTPTVIVVAAIIRD